MAASCKVRITRPMCNIYVPSTIFSTISKATVWNYRPLFASWCINQGVKCTVEFVPGHAVNRLYDKEGKAYPVDLTMLASSMAQFPILSDSLGATDFANVDRFYNILMTRSQQDEINTYQQGRKDDPVNYSTIDVYRLRQWLPSFNIGGNYLHTRAAAVEEDALQIVETLYGALTII